jgi:5-bromo-4-chloroindolyl phosphate hydrolysis protein
MTEFAKMDIFFLITSIAVVVLTALLAVLAIYIIKISSDIKYISGKAKNEADFIAKDLSDLRENVREKGANLKYFASFFNNLRKSAQSGKEKK